MQAGVQQAAYLGRFASIRFAWGFLRDPLVATRQAFDTFGPYVVAKFPLPIRNSWKTWILAVGSAFNREVLGNPTTWRTVNIGPGGPKGSASRRLAVGIVRMGGKQHAHYRRLLVPPLRRDSVEALGEDMIRLAEKEIYSWPIGEPVDLRQIARRLIRTFAIELLFGGGTERGLRIADMISRGLEWNWSKRVAGCPINLPFTPYGKMLREGDVLERCILDWASSKRGKVDQRDLLSIVVNNPDENGCPPSDVLIAGHVPTLFGAAYETCQNILTWTLILLAQHPQVSRDLHDELAAKLARSPPTLARVGDLPLLEAVVRESMRILPPVPAQFRVALKDTELGGNPVRSHSRVVLSAFLTNRLSDLYPEADRYLPERWTKIDPTSFEYLAFSGGPRSCPGSAFGLSVVKVALATILMRYGVALGADQRIDYQVGVALSPRRAVAAVLRRQDGVYSASPVRGTIHDLVHFPD